MCCTPAHCIATRQVSFTASFPDLDDSVADLGTARGEAAVVQLRYALSQLLDAISVDLVGVSLDDATGLLAYDLQALGAADMSPVLLAENATALVSSVVNTSGTVLQLPAAVSF